jgi:acyl-CoA thioester hydrolase
MEIRIYYEDTDCGGVVYYANYLKYFERARTAYLDERGISVAQLLEEGTQFVVVHAEVEYRAPARYGETLLVETRLSEEGRAALKFHHTIREKKTGRTVVEGSATLITMTRDGKVKRLDPVLVRTLLAPSQGVS